MGSRFLQEYPGVNGDADKLKKHLHKCLFDCACLHPKMNRCRCQLPKRRAYAMPPTPHCNTNAISLGNTSCSSLLARSHDENLMISKKCSKNSIKVHRLRLGLPFLALAAEAQTVVLLTAANLQLLFLCLQVHLSGCHF